MKSITSIIAFSFLAFLIFIIHLVPGYSANDGIDQTIIAPAEQLGKAFSAIASRIKPAVVSVYSETAIKFRQEDIPFSFGDDFLKEFFGAKAPKASPRGLSHELVIPQFGMGSGMVLDHAGNILTNYHVVYNVDEIKVRFFDQRTFRAKVIGKDARTDVAIIRLEGRGFEKYPTINWGDSEMVQVGNLVLAIGAPFGLTQTVTHGIISATGRSDVGIADYENFLQTDAPINPGNSGGPLVNIRGEVIGMNSAIATNTDQSAGIGFATPSNMIKAVLPKLIKGESITRGELGVIIQNLTEELAQQFGLNDTRGVLIAQVKPGSAAEKADILVEDIIIKYDGKPAEGVTNFRNLVAGTMPGEKIKIELLRKKKMHTITAVVGLQSTELADREISTKEKSSFKDLGLSVETLTKSLAHRFRASALSGVVIVDIEEGSPASIAGLQIGDVVVQINHQQLRNAEDFKEILSRSKESDMLMLVKRQAASIFVTIQLD